MRKRRKGKEKKDRPPDLCTSLKGYIQGRRIEPRGRAKERGDLDGRPPTSMAAQRREVSETRNHGRRKSH